MVQSLRREAAELKPQKGETSVLYIGMDFVIPEAAFGCCLSCLV